MRHLIFSVAAIAAFSSYTFSADLVNALLGEEEPIIAKSIAPSSFPVFSFSSVLLEGFVAKPAAPKSMVEILEASYRKAEEDLDTLAGGAISALKGSGLKVEVMLGRKGAKGSLITVVNAPGSGGDISNQKILISQLIGNLKIRVESMQGEETLDALLNKFLGSSKIEELNLMP